MPRYVLHLGREPDLSIAEIESFFGAEGVSVKDPRLVGQTLVVQTEEILDPKKIIGRLGGTIRIAEEASTFDHKVSADDLADVIFQQIMGEIGEGRRKYPFGISLAGSPGREKTTSVSAVAKAVKAIACKGGAAVRFILPGKGTALSGAQVKENHLIERGAEFLVSYDQGEFVVARTLAVQDYQEDVIRDMEKPDRRVREGLLPPKIARIMVNLSRQPGTRSLLDPFCGSGVVLMEALAMGLDAYGVDTAQSAVDASRNNLEWFSRFYAVSGKYSLKKGDSRTLSDLFAPLSLDSAATEPDLGPPLRRQPTLAKAKESADRLRDLYVRVLAEMRIVLRPGSRVVFITPVFVSEGGLVPVVIENDLRMMGYRTGEPAWKVGNWNPPKEFLHRRPGQKVMRRINILKT